jgi:hypothetical protein
MQYETICVKSKEGLQHKEQGSLITDPVIRLDTSRDQQDFTNGSPQSPVRRGPETALCSDGAVTFHSLTA